ncbi:MAG: PD-(D/E)XK nuclease family transposase [Lachnospiraceae bacterium]|nr:PD-(D/E)XK nuclease family transposase [Lachnospiraceae bacterium]
MEDFEEKKKSVAEYHLTSDLFAGKVFEDLKASQELCRILLQNDKLVLRSVKTQYVIRNLKKHSVELDILAEDVERNFINIEIQMYQENAPFRRSRYYLSSIDMDILEKGKPYQSLPDVTIIYLTKNDFIGDKRGCYDICRKSNGQDVTMCLENGLHEKYYNLEYPTDDMRVNELLWYFRHSDPFYETENFPGIVERVRFFKIKEEGVTIMCEIADRIRREGKIEGKIEDILELLRDLGKVPKRLIELISRETNLEQLSRWHKCAAKARSLAEFEARMNV